MASVGQLAAGVAHEINNPVGFINSNVTSLKSYLDTYATLSKLVGKLTQAISIGDEVAQVRVAQELSEFASQQDFSFIDSDIKELIADTEDGLNRVIEIVKNMKSFSRADSDTMQMFDVNQCISTTAKMVKEKVEQNASLILELQDLPQTAINVGKINQVITNLIVNAAQAVQAGGEVTVKSYPQGNTIVVEVRDNGCGMDNETLRNIFNPFFTTKAEGEGTGLGLSISFEIIQEHKGFIEVDSKQGVGTTFIVSLPIRQLTSADLITNTDEMVAEQNEQEQVLDDLPEHQVTKTTNDGLKSDDSLQFDNEEDGEFL
jgi:signal transduction histidine kinase